MSWISEQMHRCWNCFFGTHWCRSIFCRRHGSRKAREWARQQCRSAEGHCCQVSFAHGRRLCAPGAPGTSAARLRRIGLLIGSLDRRTSTGCRSEPPRTMAISGTGPNRTAGSRTAMGCHGDLMEKSNIYKCRPVWNILYVKAYIRLSILNP